MEILSQKGIKIYTTHSLFYTKKNIYTYLIKG